MPFRRPNRSTWYVQIATPRGAVRRSTGTSDRTTAEAIEAALRDLRARGAGDLVEAAADGRLSLDEVLASGGDAERLRAAAREIDLAPLVELWSAGAGGRLSPGTAHRYLRVVRSLVRPGEVFPRPALTAERIERWLAAYPGREATKRAARGAISRFADFLVDRGVLASNPVRATPAPPPAPPRCRWIDAGAMTRLAESQPAPFGALAALLGGTGLEVRAALRLHRRDVDLDRREIRAPGSRPHAAGRVVRVADWAWRHVSRHCRGLAPDEALFAGIARRQVETSHRRACEAAGLTDFRPSDLRHSWAVRAVRAGTPLDLVAHHLGLTGPGRVLAVYGAFVPTHTERDRWERLATAQDAERTAGEKVALGHALYHPVYQPRVTDHMKSLNSSSEKEFADSWFQRFDRGSGTDEDETTHPRTLRR
jgi:integrase/recombinase XerC